MAVLKYPGESYLWLREQLQAQRRATARCNDGVKACVLVDARAAGRDHANDCGNRQIQQREYAAIGPAIGSSRVAELCQRHQAQKKQRRQVVEGLKSLQNRLL